MALSPKIDIPMYKLHEPRQQFRGDDARDLFAALAQRFERLDEAAFGPPSVI